MKFYSVKYKSDTRGIFDYVPYDNFKSSYGMFKHLTSEGFTYVKIIKYSSFIDRTLGKNGNDIVTFDIDQITIDLTTI